MRIAAIYDIHGNLPALEVVLDEISHASVDRIVVGGDLFPGPMAQETLARLMDLDETAVFIQGNGEVAVLDAMAGGGLEKLPEQARVPVRWNAGQLRADEQRVLACWPKTFRIDVPELGPVLFCHGTPRSDNEIFTQLTPAEKLVPIFEPLAVALVVCGHTHMPFDRMVGKTRVVNAGSVGMPFGPAGADWLLLGPDVRLRHTMYDLERAAERIRQTAYPQAHEFAERYVLHPPSAGEILRAFTAAELQGG